MSVELSPEKQIDDSIAVLKAWLSDDNNVQLVLTNIQTVEIQSEKDTELVGALLATEQRKFRLTGSSKWR